MNNTKKKTVLFKRTEQSRQTKGDGRIPLHPDVPKKADKPKDVPPKM